MAFYPIEMCANLLYLRAVVCLSGVVFRLFSGLNICFYSCNIFISWHKNVIQAVYGASHWDTLGRKLKIFTKMYSFCYQRWKYPRSRSDWSCLGRTHWGWLVMHLFLPFYISMWCVSMSVIVLARDGNPLRTGAVGPFLVLCPVSSFVSCTYVWWFLHGKDVSLLMWYTCCIYVTYFVRTWIMAWWKVILSVWHPIRWRLLTWLKL